ncbi:MAG: nucleoside deaminase [Methyloprofundus sp.]|nr:nucleoside deaminase [Methyloprofundus sp.]
MTHEDFLQQAITLAVENTKIGGGPFAAIICKDNKIIASSCNAVTLNLDPTAHAEVLVIRKACQALQDFQLNDCTLYSSCEPCPMCLGAIYWARLKAVYFACNRADAAIAGFDDSFIYDEVPKAPKDRKIAMQQVSLDSAHAPFNAWQAEENKLLY